MDVEYHDVMRAYYSATYFLLVRDWIHELILLSLRIRSNCLVRETILPKPPAYWLFFNSGPHVTRDFDALVLSLPIIRYLL